MSYYDNQGSGHQGSGQQWPGPNNAPPPQPSGWDHQTPPARSGASSAIPLEEPQAFCHQIEEVDRAIDNLMKSGKMFNMGGRHGRVQPPSGPRTQSMAELGAGDARVHSSQSNLQTFYSSQRHQSSRGSNEAESMMQAKRRMAAQRERDLRNYHQEQQYNRTAVPDAPGYAGKTTRTISPAAPASSGMSEEERRDLIARQRSALYGEGSFAESGGYVDETGASRPGIPGSQPGASGPQGAVGLGGPSPLTYELPRGAPQAGSTSQQPNDPNQRSRANSTSSPHSNAPSNKGGFENAQATHQSSRTSNSSPGDSPPGQGGQGAPIGTKPGQPAAIVAPIGTRPGVASVTATQLGLAANPASNKRSSPPLASPLTRGDDGTPAASGAGPSNPPSASADGPVGMSGWGSRSSGWGNKSGLQPSASVWG